jgi:iron(III) transport system substrate-binding protein
MTPVRSDVEAPAGTNIDGANMRAIRVGPELLANLDQIKRLRFLREWRSALKQD